MACLNCNMIYKCLECGEYFTEDDAINVNVNMECEYGVSSIFNDHTNETCLGCPVCQCTDLEELSDCDIVEILNSIKVKNK